MKMEIRIDITSRERNFMMNAIWDSRNMELCVTDENNLKNDARNPKGIGLEPLKRL